MFSRRISISGVFVDDAVDHQSRGATGRPGAAGVGLVLLLLLLAVHSPWYNCALALCSRANRVSLYTLFYLPDIRIVKQIKMTRCRLAGTT